MLIFSHPPTRTNPNTGSFAISIAATNWSLLASVERDVPRDLAINELAQGLYKAKPFPLVFIGTVFEKLKIAFRSKDVNVEGCSFLWFFPLRNIKTS